MEQYIGHFITLGGSLAAFAFGYGRLTARLGSVERAIEQAVTRREFEVLESRLKEVVDEMRGLRQDIIMIWKGGN